MFDIYVQTILEANWAPVGFLFLGAVVLAHFVGMWFANGLKVDDGHSREVMPGLPVAPMVQGRAAVRFHRAVQRAERRLLRRFATGASGVEAHALAAEISEDPLVVSAALERLREEIPCRLRITASGRLLHDFRPDDIARLRRRRRALLPVRIGVFLLAALANIGAIWPVLLILTIALWTLDVAVSNTAEQAVQLGAIGLGAVVAAFAAALAGGWISHFALTPLTSAPRIGDARTFTPIDDWRSPSHRNDRSWFVWFGHSGSGGSSGSSGGSSSRRGGGDSGGGGAGLGQIIIIIIAIAIIVLCTIAIFVWCRGLWRALSSDERELERLSPAQWTRTAIPLDRFERFLPTNDLVGRVYRAIRRAHAHRRPVDQDLGPRVLALAKDQAGRISTIDLALREGLDLDEAAEVGSRLCGLVGGRILVSDHGDLAFQFPQDVIDRVRAPTKDDEWAEYLRTASQVSGVRRRDGLPSTPFPSNFVGLTYGHLVATDRLVGGTWLMAISGMLLLNLNHAGLVHFQLFAPLADLLASVADAQGLIMFLLFALAFGTTCLSAAARYTARALAEHGVRRDVRRATMHLLEGALHAGDRRLDLEPLVRRLHDTLNPAWRGASTELIEREVRGVLVDLDLTPSLQAGGRLEVELAELRTRRESAVRDASGVFDEPPVFDSTAADDEIVFDTQITHDRVKVLA